MVREISGHEENVPERVAQVVVDLAGRDDPPLRLVLGGQALQYVQAAAQQLAASDEQWRSVTESTVA
jgi:hypothetical protein